MKDEVKNNYFFVGMVCISDNQKLPYLLETLPGNFRTIHWRIEKQHLFCVFIILRACSRFSQVSFKGIPAVRSFCFYCSTKIGLDCVVQFGSPETPGGFIRANFGFNEQEKRIFLFFLIVKTSFICQISYLPNSYSDAKY